MSQKGAPGQIRTWLIARNANQVTLGEFTEFLGDRSLAILVFVLTLLNAFFIPSIPPLPLLAGIPAVILLARIACGAQQATLPEFWKTRSVSLKTALRITKWMQFFLRPVSPRLDCITGEGGRRFFALLCIVFTIFACAPTSFGLLAGVGALMLAMGLVEDDGLFYLLGTVVGICGIGLEGYMYHYISSLFL